ncbi:hypothetical protein CXG81DRAFT_15351 [Caulochytrium protostelioides]|uniref:Ubiquitin-conjugating enzyme protein UbcC n=1 Tax=Caulochytrium protostelioides TaxID=1555241 RepID=A0A4P9X1Y3_9FUNG|nr:ubiquitin-conjugating enzyme protein UbcC [Caulochytrium protostelioides]RKO98851.1 hypothetical protein CXG81DRAFT_15351 [Caulochytrium protostelioides]|eukprot:RKO98851.1 hypothetical protein CXG81DRAFT_15351 [Caulochytrium protostelioides]
MSAAHALQRQLTELKKHPVPGFRVDILDDNIFEWQVGIIGPPKTLYEGGYFLATLRFPADFPFQPPTFRFKRPLFHPNVYDDGRLCISILHPPGDDPMSGETAAERWNPTQSVESILLSVISLLSDPNCSSPANVDAGKVYRTDRARYEQIVRQQVHVSKQDSPPGLDVEAEYDTARHAAERVRKQQQLQPPHASGHGEDDAYFWYEDEEDGEEDDDADVDEFDDDGENGADDQDDD